MVLQMIRGYKSVFRKQVLVIFGTIPMVILLKENYDIFHRMANTVDRGLLSFQMREKSLKSWKESRDLSDNGKNTYQFSDDASLLSIGIGTCT